MFSPITLVTSSYVSISFSLALTGFTCSSSFTAISALTVLFISSTRLVYASSTVSLSFITATTSLSIVIAYALFWLVCHINVPPATSITAVPSINL